MSKHYKQVLYNLICRLEFDSTRAKPSLITAKLVLLSCGQVAVTAIGMGDSEGLIKRILLL